MTRTYKTYEAKSNENRTPWTMFFGHNVRMELPKDRLKQARIAAGFKTTVAAVEAYPRDLNINTLTSHQNGNRDISRKAAEKYARVFNTTAGWLLYGERQGMPISIKRLWDAVQTVSVMPRELQDRIADFAEYQISRYQETHPDEST